MLFKSALYLLILAFVFTLKLSSQPLPILLKGVVTDEFTGKPIGVDIEFRDTGGKKIKINSNSITGAYQQIVNSGEFYEVILSGTNIIRKTDRVKIENYQKYTEQETDFTVRRLEPGSPLYKLSAFKTGENKLDGDIHRVFEEIQEIMKFNRSVSFEFVVNSKDTYKSVPDVKVPEPTVTKGKKKKSPPKTKPIVKQPDPDSELIKSLTDARLAEIQKILEENNWKRYSKRVSTKADYSLGDSESGISLQYHNLLIIVSSLDPALEKN